MEFNMDVYYDMESDTWYSMGTSFFIIVYYVWSILHCFYGKWRENKKKYVDIRIEMSIKESN